MNSVTRQSQKGFTLVEIAIVLVIVGLLLGGVLKGQELIANAKIKQFTTEMEEVVAAAYAYQDRMGRFPGRLGQHIDIDMSAFWQDLEREGFISKSLAYYFSVLILPHSLNGFFIVLPSYASFPVANFKNALCASNLTESIAQAVDRKLDDGNPNTGDILAGKTVYATLTDYSSPESIVVLCKVFK